ncbi:unnamed protein product, partial [Ixodes hexagonus]
YFVFSPATGTLAKDSNNFMDSVLLEKMPPLVKSSLKLYPFATMEDFKFKVPSTAITNRELRASLRSGAIRGFEDGIHRVGDCEIPTLVSGNTSIICVLDFNGLNASLSAEVAGDSLSAPTKMVTVNVAVVDTAGRFEASALPDKPGVVRTFYVEQINLRTTYGHNLHLNRPRQNKFVHEVEMRVHSALYHLLYGEYLRLLNQAVESAMLPQV